MTQDDLSNYLAEQARWVEQTGVVKGDKVVVLAKPTAEFPDIWLEDMDNLIGTTGTMEHAGNAGILVDFPKGIYAMPFFVLAVEKN